MLKGRLQDDSAQLTVVKSLQEIYLEFIPYYTNKQKRVNIDEGRFQINYHEEFH